MEGFLKLLRHFKAILGVGKTPLHKPYIHTALIGEDSSISLVFQIPYEDRCLNPQTPPSRRPLGVPFSPSQMVFGGFWKTRERILPKYRH